MSDQEKLPEKQLSRRDMLKMLGGSAAGLSMAKIAGLGGGAAALLQGMPVGAQTKVEIWTGFGQGRMAERHARRHRQFRGREPRICSGAHHRALGRDP